MKITPSAHDTWFAAGIRQQGKPCPHPKGSEAANHWEKGASFARKLGFEGVTRALYKNGANQNLSPLEIEAFASDGTVRPEIVAAAEILRADYEAEELLLTLEAYEPPTPAPQLEKV